MPNPVPRSVHFPHAVRAAIVSIALALSALVLGSGAIPCAFAKIFHVPCPACGTTRSVRALLHLDVLGALRFNPLGPFVAALLLQLGLFAIWLTAREGNIERLGQHRYGAWISRLLAVALVLEVLAWLLRFAGFFGGPVQV